MKKILNLLTVLVISGTAVTTSVAVSPYQKEETIKNTNINEQQTDNMKELNKNEKEENNINMFGFFEKHVKSYFNNFVELSKKNIKSLINNFLNFAVEKIFNLEYLSSDKNDFYAKEQIEFFNNNFFHKFNMDFNDGKITGTMSSDSKRVSSERTITEDWTKYAKNWEEFETKFPQIEFIGLWAQLGGRGDDETVKEFKMPTKLNSTVRLMNYNYPKISTWAFCVQNSYIDIELFLDGKQLKIRHNYYFSSSNCVYRTWSKLKYDAIRLVGKVDVNPLFLLTAEKAKQFDNWANSKEEELQTKRNDKNYNKDILMKEEMAFKEEFKLWLIEMLHGYIQDLIILDQNNQIINLRAEIDEIKSRLDKLEEKKHA
ncbi:hypothetical protein [Spiroplasma melliferum]|uniref:Spiroplasmavirus-related protein n=2 Tax=Spiroplasma melliferum TaxID=2134 RepID=A0AAI9T2Q4_SPIME|nr:hypothetical protein [Spiroplasma melliferum]KAI92298.1 hypothetical protein SPM_006190 [Spiroplasma melliferum KC3]QCO23730.1 hypothetical protein SRED_002204 [Spiroplasma melliferum]